MNSRRALNVLACNNSKRCYSCYKHSNIICNNNNIIKRFINISHNVSNLASSPLSSSSTAADIKVLASKGDIKSIVEIARQLIDGERKLSDTVTCSSDNKTTISIEEETARLWLEIAAIDHDDPEAQFLLALLLDEINKKQLQSTAQTGEDVLKEIQQARKAAIANKKRKKMNKNNIVEENVIQVEQTVSTLSLLRKAANQGHGKAMCYLGNKLLEKGDVLEAVKWYKLSTSTNPPVTDALYNLGSLYYEGRTPTLEIDLPLSLSYFISAADAGDLSACFWCGYCYMTGSGGVQKIDPNKAIMYLNKSAVEGNGTAHYHLATVYRSGLSDCCSTESDCNHKASVSIKPNKELFHYHVNKAVELEDPDAMFCMADIYFHGLEGVEKDVDKAKKLYESASKLDHVEATVALGALYYNGIGGYKKDRSKAFELYNKAAEKGSLEAWRNLASMYYLGDGIDKSEDMAKQIMKNVFGKEI